MIRFALFLSFFLSLVSRCLIAQVSDIIPSKQLPFLQESYDGSMAGPDISGSYREFVNSFDYKGPSIEGNWEFLGPDVLPEEKPSKLGVPAYALNRGNGTGRINYLLLDPYQKGRVFACSPTGGLFVSEDGGENWRSGGTDQLPISGVSTVTVDRKNADVWWIATGDGDDNFMFSDGVWRTEDAGTTWTNINGQSDSLSIPVSVYSWLYTRSCEILSHPKCRKKLYYTSNKGLYYSRNGKHNPDKIKWEKKLDGFIYDLEIFPWSPKTILASGDHIHLSTNYGKSWEQLPDPEPIEKGHNFVRINAELSPDDQEHIYAVVTSRQEWDTRTIGDATLQKFNLKSREWTVVRNLNKKMNNVIPSRARAFAVSPVDANNILCGNVQPVYSSTDGGVEFQAIEKNQMHDDIHHLVFEPDGQTVWAAHDGGVSISYDAGLNWQDRSKGIAAANVFGVDVAQQEELQLLFGGYDTGGNLLLDGKWYHVCFGDGFQNVIHDEDPQLMITTRQGGGLIKSVADGVFDKRGGTSRTKTAWHTWLRTDPFNPSTVYLAGTKLMRSTNFGDDYESILDASSLGDLYWTYTLYPSEFHPEVLYSYLLPESGMEHRIARTMNANAPADEVKWELIPEFPIKNWVAGLQVDADNPEACTLAFGIFKKKEKVWHFDGREYEDISYNLDFAIPSAMIADRESGALYLGTTHGVFLLDKAKKHWVQIDGLPGTFIRSLVINYATGKLVAGTYGRGVWQCDLPKP